jgi:predicted nucleic acid-binding protein
VIHLDTCLLIDLYREMGRNKPGPAFEAFESLDDHETLAVSVHVLSELRVGAELARNPLKENEELDALVSGLVVAYPDERFATTFARTLAAVERSRRRIATMDLLIATAALVDNAALLTKNVKDFSSVPGLRLIRY